MNPNSSMTGTADDAVLRASAEVALRQDAVIGSISPRAQIAVAGPDRAAYLQGLLTNDIQALAEGSGCYAAWLSPQGRMLTDMHVLQSSGMILLDVPAGQASAVLARLDQFLFSEDVRIESLVEAMTGVWVHGPKAAAVLERVIHGLAGLADWNDYRHDTATFDGNPVSVARIDQLGVPGYCVFLSRAAEAQFVAAALRGRGERCRRRDVGRRAHRSRLPVVRRRHDRRHDSARGRNRAARDLVYEGLLRRPGSRHPRAASRRRTRREEAGWVEAVRRGRSRSKDSVR